jgi:folate-binding protein YgfZ
MDPTPLEAFAEGPGFAELAGWRIAIVGGVDARGWLHDLVTADVEGILPGEARRSLVLTPTGRIRADFHVVAQPERFVLLQPPGQPEDVDAILAPYVLSSDVRIVDRTEESSLFLVLGRIDAEDEAIGHVSRPSVMGPGVNLVTDAGEARDGARSRMAEAGREEVSDEDLDRWRIVHGIARMGADFPAASLPSEASLEDTIDFSKGCFLGQESVAKVRNLGHPPRVLVPVASDGPLERGDTVLEGDAPVGEITSATKVDGAGVGIARVRWSAGRSATLSTPAGSLRLRHPR